ncbi:MAG TPA: MarR family transcriptional regulator [Candidatus Limnocylindria bacterium]|nr:MarR family transcriptional regulator [Candidatus Limnocylindria bacterium]
MPIAAANIVEEILDQLQPLISRQRRAIAREGCFRAISSTQLHVLFMLLSDGPTTMSHLAESLSVSLPNVTGIVDRMVENGLVERGGADDRRIVTVEATAAGRNTVEEIDLVRRRQLAAVLTQLNPDQQRRALETFTELRLAAERLDRQGAPA